MLYLLAQVGGTCLLQYRAKFSSAIQAGDFACQCDIMEMRNCNSYELKSHFVTLNQAVKRNEDRFQTDLCFSLHLI